MTPLWISAGLVLGIGMVLFLGAVGLIYIGYRFGDLSPIARQRWKIACFAGAVVIVSEQCMELLVSSDKSRVGLALLPLILLWFSQHDDGTDIGGRKPSKLTMFCGGFTVLMLICDFCNWAPPSVSQPVQRVVHYPGFIIPVWIFIIWQLFRLWQKWKSRSPSWPRN